MAREFTHGVTTVIVLLGSISVSAGIKCFSCNSHYDRNCADPFNNYTTELVNCNQEDHRMNHLPLINGTKRHTANICRKTVQIVENEERIIRSCGWLPNTESMKDRECFTRTGTHQVMVYHCVCNEDGCNGCGLITSSASFILIALLLQQIFNIKTSSS